jgi:hypothetical protein
MSATESTRSNRYLLEISWTVGEMTETKQFFLRTEEVFPFLKGRFVACNDMLRLIEVSEMDRTITNLPSRVYALLSHLNRLETNVHYHGIIRGTEDRDHG